MQEMAATKIQALGRRKRDARRAKQIRHQNHLFVKLDSENANSASRQKIIDFVQGGQARDRLELPYRLTSKIPEQVQGLFKSVLVKLQDLNKQFLTWEDFSSIFGLSKHEADAAREHIAVIRIQAISRQRRVKADTAGRRRKTMHSDQSSEAPEAQKATEGNHSEIVSASDAVDHEKQNVAAVKIQSRARGMSQRKRFAERRRKRDERNE
eukprot:763811-Hanusia_phi.AAC.11